MLLRRNRPESGPKSLRMSSRTSKSPYFSSVIRMPPLPLMSWVPKIAFSFSSTVHLPPDLFLLAALWPVSALTFQPLSVLPSKMRTKPFSRSFSLSLSRPSARGSTSRARGKSRAASMTSRRTARSSGRVVPGYAGSIRPGETGGQPRLSHPFGAGDTSACPWHSPRRVVQYTTCPGFLPPSRPHTGTKNVPPASRSPVAASARLRSARRRPEGQTRTAQLRRLAPVARRQTRRHQHRKEPAQGVAQGRPQAPVARQEHRQRLLRRRHRRRSHLHHGRPRPQAAGPLPRRQR